MLGAILGAVGGLASSLIGNKSASSTGKMQQQAQQQAIDLQKRMYDETQGRLKPGVDLFAPGIDNLMGVLEQKSPTSADVMSNPLYQQNLNNANRNVLNASAGTGNTGSSASNTSLALVQPQIFGQTMDMLNQERARQINEAMIPINIGQSATGQANTAGANYGNTMGQAFQQLGQIQGARKNTQGAGFQNALNFGSQLVTPTKQGGFGVLEGLFK